MQVRELARRLRSPACGCCSNPSIPQAGFLTPNVAPLIMWLAIRSRGMQWHEREAEQASKRQLDKSSTLRDKIARLKEEADKKRARAAGTAPKPD